MKYFILAGEASGDKQAALLCRSILLHDDQAILRGWGGEEMIAAGVHVTKHYRDLAYMGFVEVIRHLPDIMRNFKSCKNEIASYQPDALILVDYPGFNLRMATWAYQKNIPVYYYISPQLWAWHSSRVHKIKKAVRRMYVILPFEKEFYAGYGMNAMYIGHPLALSMKNQVQPVVERNEKQIALLPGSRKHEIEKILPVMAELPEIMPEYSFHVMTVDHLPLQLYQDIIGHNERIQLEKGKLHVLLRQSKAAVVTSGTATLETALTGTPQVVVYKGNSFSYQLAKRLIKVPFISLVNLIAGKQIVPELIQENCNALNIKNQLMNILEPGNYETVQSNYMNMNEQLQHGGGPDAAAADIISDLQQLKRSNGKV